MSILPAELDPAPLTVDEARQLTDDIRRTAGRLWELLAEAHDRKAWKALGYTSFRAYVDDELNISRSRAYQLLDQAQVITALTEAAGVSTKVDTLDVSERDARDLKPHLEAVTAAVREATEDTEPERRAETARAAVGQVRDRIADTRRQAEPAETPEATPSPSAPRRGSLVDQASTAGWALRKAVERMERIAADDRYPANRSQVAALNRGHLAYAVEVCQDLYDGLDTSPLEGQ